MQPTDFGFGSIWTVWTTDCFRKDLIDHMWKSLQIQRFIIDSGKHWILGDVHCSLYPTSMSCHRSNFRPSTSVFYTGVAISDVMMAVKDSYWELFANHLEIWRTISSSAVCVPQDGITLIAAMAMHCTSLFDVEKTSILATEIAKLGLENRFRVFVAVNQRNSVALCEGRPESRLYSGIEWGWWMFVVADLQNPRVEIRVIYYGTDVCCIRNAVIKSIHVTKGDSSPGTIDYSAFEVAGEILFARIHSLKLSQIMGIIPTSAQQSNFRMWTLFSIHSNTFRRLKMLPVGKRSLRNEGCHWEETQEQSDSVMYTEPVKISLNGKRKEERKSRVILTGIAFNVRLPNKTVRLMALVVFRKLLSTHYVSQRCESAIPFKSETAGLIYGLTMLLHNRTEMSCWQGVNHGMRNSTSKPSWFSSCSCSSSAMTVSSVCCYRNTSRKVTSAATDVAPKNGQIPPTDPDCGDDVCHIPQPVFSLFVYLAQQGGHVNDMFRRPGNITQMKQILHEFTSGNPVDWSEYNVYTVANVAKKLLLSIPDGLFGVRGEALLLSTASGSSCSTELDELLDPVLSSRSAVAESHCSRLFPFGDQKTVTFADDLNPLGSVSSRLPRGSVIQLTQLSEVAERRIAVFLRVLESLPSSHRQFSILVFGLLHQLVMNATSSAARCSLSSLVDLSRSSGTLLPKREDAKDDGLAVAEVPLLVLAEVPLKLRVQTENTALRRSRGENSYSLTAADNSPFGGGECKLYYIMNYFNSSVKRFDSFQLRFRPISGAYLYRKGNHQRFTSDKPATFWPVVEHFIVRPRMTEQQYGWLSQTTSFFLDGAVAIGTSCEFFFESIPRIWIASRDDIAVVQCLGSIQLCIVLENTFGAISSVFVRSDVRVIVGV
ncbi:hypothetical protein CLF_106248 [Clonorchis sinensis]|uniref:Rho-GAP domain-containing protein n=1 Tax=Clonorchis sinensis TaxID=79923 RepID=G7YEV9_CLOSI|nr:hypothetical protein CLF_106248 [Clonorchis sinensis]